MNDRTPGALTLQPSNRPTHPITITITLRRVCWTRLEEDTSVRLNRQVVSSTTVLLALLFCHSGHGHGWVGFVLVLVLVLLYCWPPRLIWGCGFLHSRCLFAASRLW